jgi:hypothetical protein
MTLADIGRLTFTVELFHSMPDWPCEAAVLSTSQCRCVATSYFIHEVENSPTGTDEEIESASRRCMTTVVERIYVVILLWTEEE